MEAAVKSPIPFGVEEVISAKDDDKGVHLITRTENSPLNGPTHFLFAHECERGEVIHLKGNTKDLDVNDEAMRNQLLAVLRAHIPFRGFVFDGDDYAEDSYTALIPWLVDKWKNWRPFSVTALCRYEDLYRVERSWKGKLSGSGIFLEFIGFFPRRLQKISASDVPSEWARLGITGLQFTRSPTVVCIGKGGEVLKQERAYWDKKQASCSIQWFVIPFPKRGDAAPQTSAAAAAGSSAGECLASSRASEADI